jgi:hypothetical protein
MPGINAKTSPEPNERPTRSANDRDSELNQLIAALSAITDPEDRKAFYHAHPELRRFYSPVNFH